MTRIFAQELQGTNVLVNSVDPGCVRTRSPDAHRSVEEGVETTYRIVGVDEADVRAGRLGIESPLARALLGRELGESVRVERPRGAVEYTIVRVTYRAPSA